MSYVPNDTEEVTNIKGVQGGYGFSAPLGTNIISTSDPFATIAAATVNMGFISSDGVEETKETDNEEVADLNGDVVYVIKTKEKELQKFTLINLSDGALPEMFGHKNVTAGNDYTTIKHTSDEYDRREYLFDLLLKDGRKWRKYIPNGQVTEVGSIVYGAGQAFAREITITCYPDSTGTRVYDFIENEAATTTTTTTTTTTGE